jgi:hypothetical protein
MGLSTLQLWGVCAYQIGVAAASGYLLFSLGDTTPLQKFALLDSMIICASWCALVTTVQKRQLLYASIVFAITILLIICDVMIWSCPALTLCLKLGGGLLLLSVVTILRKLPVRLSTSSSRNITVTNSQKCGWLGLYVVVCLGHTFPRNEFLQAAEVGAWLGVWGVGCFHYAGYVAMLRGIFQPATAVVATARSPPASPLRMARNPPPAAPPLQIQQTFKMKRARQKIRQNMVSSFGGFNLGVVILILSNAIWLDGEGGTACSRRTHIDNSYPAQIRLCTSVAAVVATTFIIWHTLIIFTAAQRKKMKMKMKMPRKASTIQKRVRAGEGILPNPGSYRNKSDSSGHDSSGSYDNESKSSDSSVKEFPSLQESSLPRNED